MHSDEEEKDGDVAEGALDEALGEDEDETVETPEEDEKAWE